MVVLAGGMATRFGGGVKAVAEAIDGRSFLEVKLGETQRLADALGAEIPVALMTSFATDEVVRAHVAEQGARAAARSSADGGAAPAARRQPLPRCGRDGRRSTGPGHGDLLADPRLGHARRARRGAACARSSSRTSTISARARRPGDRRDARPRGHAAHRRGRRQGRRHRRRSGAGRRPAAARSRRCSFPPGFDQARIPVFNTNTSLIDVEALAEPVELTWLVTEKRVDGESAVQFERLYHELSAHVPTTFLVVPRHGPRGRFLPVKEPADLGEVAAAPARDARRSPRVATRL